MCHVCLAVTILDKESGERLIASTLRNHCVSNEPLAQYEEANLELISSYLVSDGCVWQNSSVRRRRAAADTSSNPTIRMLQQTAHVLHIISVVILAIMVVEVSLPSHLVYLFMSENALAVLPAHVIFMSGIECPM